MSGVRLSGSFTTVKGKGGSVGVRNKDKPSQNEHSSRGHPGVAIVNPRDNLK